ncbi:MAG: DUF378 domain-containing protein [Candidatus Aenigmarchaeota archaeon]|nr:DUF378 domain-containing protein [Candidatus Aenigmarchaeota archaeon]
MDNKTLLDVIALILLVVGGLNWGLYAIGMNLVEMLFGTTIIATIIYVLVALSAVYAITIVMDKMKK